jgi:hypothetical protein
MNLRCRMCTGVLHACVLAVSLNVCRSEFGVQDLVFGPDKEHHQRFLGRALGETAFVDKMLYFANIPYKVCL